MTELIKRRLGRTGLDVTLLGFGAMELRGEGGRRGRPLPGTASVEHLRANAGQVRLGPLEEGTYHAARKRLQAVGAVPAERQAV